MAKQVYEIFEEIKNLTKKEDIFEILRKNNTKMLRDVLLGAYHPNIKFIFTTIPKYKPLLTPPGMGYMNMSEALSKIYLFIENHPKVSPNLTMKRKEQLLIQILEALEPKEAKIYEEIILKKLNIPIDYEFAKQLLTNKLP